MATAWLFARERLRIIAADTAPRTTWAIVLGAPPASDGPSAILEDRLRAGVDLFQRGVVRTLLLSGDDGKRRSDEVTVMRAFVLKLGVPEASILVDPEGRSTFETFRRAANEFG